MILVRARARARGGGVGVAWRARVGRVPSVRVCADKGAATKTRPERGGARARVRAVGWGDDDEEMATRTKTMGG